MPRPEELLREGLLLMIPAIGYCPCVLELLSIKIVSFHHNLDVFSSYKIQFYLTSCQIHSETEETLATSCRAVNQLERAVPLNL